MKKVSRETKLLVCIEAISAICGIIGVVFGTLSLLALSPPVWGGTEESRDQTSFVFTCVTVGLDSLSTLAAILAFKYSGFIIKQKSEAGMEISQQERFANRLDLYSFAFGLVGLILSILSLMFLFPFAKTNPGSEIATLLSIICDSVSALIVIWVVKITIKISIDEYKIRKKLKKMQKANAEK